MTSQREDYLNAIALDLCSYIRTLEGFAPHPTYLDESVIDFLDGVVAEEHE